MIAQLLTDRALHLIRCARRVAQAAVNAKKAANLQIGVPTNREIGEAIGILMSNYCLSSEQAFGVLRRYSQDTNCKLRDIVAEVRLGTLAPAGDQPSDHGAPARRPPARTVKQR